MFSSKRLTRAIVALLIAAGLLAATAGVSSAAGGGPSLDFSHPAGIDDSDVLRFDFEQIPAWEHTVVIAYVASGSGEDYPTQVSERLGELNSLSWLQDYVWGRNSFVADYMVSVYPSGAQTEALNLSYGGSGGPSDARNPYQDVYGDIAVALSASNEVCNWHPWNPCDIVLVTHEAPLSSTHQRHAMAEAMKIVGDGHGLHTVAIERTECNAIDPDIGCHDPGDELIVDMAHIGFSELLGASGYHTVADTPTVLWAINGIMYSAQSTPVYYEPYGDDCEVRDPDGNCYYGEVDDEPEDECYQSGLGSGPVPCDSDGLLYEDV